MTVQGTKMSHFSNRFYQNVWTFVPTVGSLCACKGILVKYYSLLTRVVDKRTWHGHCFIKGRTSFHRAPRECSRELYSRGVLLYAEHTARHGVIVLPHT